MAIYNDDGSMVLSSVQKSPEEIKKDLGIQETPRYQQIGLEVAKAIPRGAVKGLKETAKLAPLAVQYAPFVAMPFEYAGRKVGGFFGDDDQDNNYSWSSEVGDYKRLVNTWGEFSRMEDARKGLDNAALPLIEALEKEYETKFGDYAELLGEFASPLAPLKAVTMGARAFNIANTLPQLQSTKRKLLKELNKQSNTQLDSSVLASPRKTYEALKKEGIKLDRDAERELAYIQKNQKKVNKLEAYNKASLRANNILTRDIASAASAAFAVHYVENNFEEENAVYLAPLAGIGAAIFAPPLFIGHGRQALYNLLGKYHELRGNEDAALDMAIRARGVDVDEIRDASGRKVTDPDELRRRKQEMIATSAPEIKFYKMLNAEIDKLPAKEKQSLMFSLDHYNHIYEKFRRRAIDKNRKELADNFIPLIGNVVQLNSIRSLHKTLMGTLNSQFLLDPRKRIFRARVGNELDDVTNMLAQQAELVRLEFEDLKKLGKLTDPTTGQMYDEIDSLMNDFKKVDLDTRGYLDSVQGQIGRNSKNILNRLELGTVGKKDIEAQLKASKAISSLAEKYNINRRSITEDFNEKNSELVLKGFLNAQQKVNDAYNRALKDENGKDITVSSPVVIDKLKQILQDKESKSILAPQGDPSINLLKLFQKEVQENYIVDFLTKDLTKSEELLENIDTFFQYNKRLYIRSKLPKDANGNVDLASQEAQDLAEQFNLRSGYKQFLKHKARHEQGSTITQKEEAASFINRYFLSKDKGDTNFLLNADEFQLASPQRVMAFVDDIQEEAMGANMRLTDIQSVRSKFQEKRLFGRTAAQKEDGKQMVEALDSFFDLDLIENPDDLANYLDKLIIANQIYKDNMLPFKSIDFQRHRRLHSEAMGLEDEYKSAREFYKDSGDATKLIELSKRVAAKGTGGDDLMRALVDPNSQLTKTASSQPARVLTSLLNNLDSNTDRNSLKEAAITSITRALREAEEKGDALSMTNRITDTYIDNFKNAKLISDGDAETLRDISIWNKKAFQDYTTSNIPIFKEAETSLKSIGRKYGDSIENNIIRAVLKAQERADNPEKVAQVVKELTNLTIGKSGKLKGFKSFVRETDELDEDLSRITDILKDEDIKNGTNFLQEAKDYLYGEDGSVTGLQRLLDYYRKGDGRGDTVEVFDEVTKQKVKMTEGEIVLKAIDDIFMQHLINVGFSATDRMSSISNMNVFTRRGRKYALNYQQNIDAPALQEAAEDLKPYLEAIHGSDSTVIKELDDLLEVKKIISQKPFDKDDATIAGMPSMMSIESGISRVYSVIRGVVSARYILTEMGLRNYRQGQKELLTKFLTDPTAIHTLHDVAVKGLDDPYHTRNLFQIIFSTPNMSVLAARAAEMTGVDKDSAETVTITTDTGEKLNVNKQWVDQATKAFSNF